ncbi:MAG: DUF3368 domain-containing protein [Symploca sp. SIO2E6]|nr:DUF3368 domain-containing protein [Symploca sp. SIO2E6]
MKQESHVLTAVGVSIQQLYECIVIPTGVYQELTVEPPVPGTVEVKTFPWIEILSVRDCTMVEQLQNTAQLDVGESEAIALALEINAELLLIDEHRGRSEANRLGIRITGLLGVLVEAKHRGLIPAVKPLMDNLIATSRFRVSQSLYNQILAIVGES